MYRKLLRVQIMYIRINGRTDTCLRKMLQVSMHSIQVPKIELRSRPACYTVYWWGTAEKTNVKPDSYPWEQTHFHDFHDTLPQLTSNHSLCISALLDHKLLECWSYEWLTEPSIIFIDRTSQWKGDITKNKCLYTLQFCSRALGSEWGARRRKWYSKGSWRKECSCS